MGGLGRTRKRWEGSQSKELAAEIFQSRSCKFPKDLPSDQRHELVCWSSSLEGTLISWETAQRLADTTLVALSTWAYLAPATENRWLVRASGLSYGGLRADTTD